MRQAYRREASQVGGIASLSHRCRRDGRSRKRRVYSPIWTLSWWFTLGCLTLMSFTSCRATVGHMMGQQFVSPAYAFEVPLPGDEWQPVPDEPSVLTIAHTQLAAGITISVTCIRHATRLWTFSRVICSLGSRA